MQGAINKSAPTLGVALGYFIVMMWAVPAGHIQVDHQVEAVAMAGVLATNVIMETKVFFRWVGSFYRKAPSSET